ncbi:MAG: helix-turn-helix transcriptional regulator [Bryobacteraceae bacterium]|nr:helix-turn-helix transcriptional regulator [Bryobacteraceae bacterium]
MRVVLLAVEKELSSAVIPPGAEVLVIPTLTSFQRSRTILHDFAPDLVICNPLVLSQLAAAAESRQGPVAASSREEAAALRSKLNKRHRDILGLLHCGLQNREIAGQLNLSARTVKAYISQLFMIFDVSNRTELVARVDDLRILDPWLEPPANVLPIRPAEQLAVRAVAGHAV